jgi:hypothetical protein
MASVGRDDEPLIVNILQDTHPSFEYTPITSWTTDFPNVGGFLGASGQ